MVILSGAGEEGRVKIADFDYTYCIIEATDENVAMDKFYQIRNEYHSQYIKDCIQILDNIITGSELKLISPPNISIQKTADDLKDLIGGIILDQRGYNVSLNLIYDRKDRRDCGQNYIDFDVVTNGIKDYQLFRYTDWLRTSCTKLKDAIFKKLSEAIIIDKSLDILIRTKMCVYSDVYSRDFLSSIDAMLSPGIIRLRKDKSLFTRRPYGSTLSYQANNMAIEIIPKDGVKRISNTSISDKMNKLRDTFGNIFIALTRDELYKTFGISYSELNSLSIHDNEFYLAENPDNIIGLTLEKTNWGDSYAQFKFFVKIDDNYRVDTFNYIPLEAISFIKLVNWITEDDKDFLKISMDMSQGQSIVYVRKTELVSELRSYKDGYVLFGDKKWSSNKYYGYEIHPSGVKTINRVIKSSLGKDYESTMLLATLGDTIE